MPDSHRRTLTALRKWSVLLDSAFRVPGTSLTFGLDPILGLIPGLKSPTSSLNTTFALAICVFVYVQYIGISRLGLGGYLHHFAGSPRDVVPAHSISP